MSIDDDFAFTWEQLQDILARNALAELKRKSSVIARYNELKKEFKTKYGGTVQYILRKKLCWVPDVDGTEEERETLASKVEPENEEFLGNKHDVKILFNDFPYAVGDNVEHVVVWSKAQAPRRADGYISKESSQHIQHYVESTFEKGLGMKKNDILWFRNSKELQSVAALEHFHVLLRNPPHELLNNLIGTGGIL